MVLKFTEKEIENIKNIITRYQIVSGELLDYQKKADEIQEKVISLNTKLKDIKDEEDILMKELHGKYGNFTIQDIYYLINQ